MTRGLCVPLRVSWTFPRFCHGHGWPVVLEKDPPSHRTPSAPQPRPAGPREPRIACPGAPEREFLGRPPLPPHHPPSPAGRTAGAFLPSGFARSRSLCWALVRGGSTGRHRQGSRRWFTAGPVGVGHWHLHHLWGLKEPITSHQRHRGLTDGKEGRR